MVHRNEENQINTHLVASFAGSPLCSSRMRSWYDVAAVLYLDLIRAFPSEERLTAVFFGEAPSPGAQNPNLESLQALSEKVCNIALSCWQLRDAEKANQALMSVQELLDGFDLQEWCDAEQNAATLLFAVLIGIDMACQNRDDIDSIDVLGPLNVIGGDEGIGVYLKPRSSYVDTIMAKSGTERIFEWKINDRLERLTLFKDDQPGKMGMPRVVSFTPPHSIQMPSEDHPLKLGIVAFAGEKMLLEDCSNSPIASEPVGGAGFGVAYSPEFDSLYSAGVANAISTAVDEKCHILVFPELVMTSGLRRVVRSSLANVTENPSLFLVVAGSAWEQGDNICHLLDAFGNEIGTYYKRSPFGTGPTSSRPKRRLAIESLAHPGKTCTLVNVRGFGLVLPSICKDLVSEDAHTVRLARAFRPLIVCCPAYSNSIDHAFDQPIGDIVERSLAMVCLANYCGARDLYDEEEAEFTRVAAPGYEIESDGEYSATHQARVEFKKVLKTKECQSSCQARGSCLFVATIDYRADYEKNAVLPHLNVERIVAM